MATNESGRRRFILNAVVAGGMAVAPPALTSGCANTSGLKAQPNTHCDQPAPPMKHVKGKVAFITGGSSGIGLGIARAFLQAGMNVVIGYRTDRHLNEAINSLRAISQDRLRAIEVDVSERDDLDKAANKTVEYFGKVHVLVNNAGVGTPARLADTSSADWDWIVNVNITGVFNGIHSFLPQIRSHGEGGHILSASSILGLMSGPGAAAYAASKFAVVGLSEALRAELAPSGIGVSVYCPGAVNTNIVEADRNRPRDESPRSLQPSPDARLATKAYFQDPRFSMSPDMVGERVLDGMRKNELYILTHIEYAEIMKTRASLLLASFPSNLPATRERVELSQRELRESIYTNELRWRRCED